jgi:hypothetical protein
MKNLNFPLLVLATFLLMAFSLSAYAGDASPKVQMERIFIDYGEIPAGKVLNPRFPFKNVGNATLEIANQLFLGKFIQTKALKGC